MEFHALGKAVSGPRRALETFPTPEHLAQITLRSEEVSSLCPITGQPDFETVIIDFEPAGRGIESKSLKLYLWSFRDEGIFCEALAALIADDVMEAARPRRCTVTVEQRPRGGISIRAVAVRTGESRTEGETK